jgi:hypothetical protein
VAIFSGGARKIVAKKGERVYSKKAVRNGFSK